MDPYASALEQAAALRRREVSPVELLEMYLDRIAALDPVLNEFVLITEELARDQAAAAERALREGTGGPLTGVPVSIKELTFLAGHRCTFGSRAFADFVAPWDDYPVARWKEEGCVILGKTNVPEFGTRPLTEYGLFGASRNPWDPERSTGGSSGGAAGALAAGLCALSHGSDGGGSCRVPGSCCGVVGLKPSRGRVSPGPVMGEGWAGLTTSGVLAHTVSDAAAGLDAMAGHLPGDPYWADGGSFAVAAAAGAGRLRVAFTTEARAGVDPEVAECVRKVARLLESMGHRVVEGGPPDTDDLRPHTTLVAVAGVASLPVADPGLLEPINAAAVEAARTITAADYVRAVAQIRAISRRVVSFWDGCDVLLTPTLTRPAPRLGTMGLDPDTAHEEFLDWLSFTHPYNCTGQPAISLPLGSTGGGLPVGVQLVGPPRGEAVILGLAAELEAADPWPRRPPGVAA